jgi:histidine triad (HIT) family protein
MCLFCKIAQHEIKADIVLEDENAVAFRDINPAAPTHVLVIPKTHIVSLNDASEADQALLGRLMLTARAVAEKLDLLNSGYRIVVNNGKDAGQSVFHLHVHVLAGRALAWPPG